jgi:hypothetical protein
MIDPARDVGLLRSIAADLEAYLKSDIVYWSLTDAGPMRQHYPQLTLGGLLFAQARLRVLASRLDPQQQTELSEVSQQIVATRARWPANWLRKAEREIETRVSAWARAVCEASLADYPAAVQSRLMLGLLLDDLAEETSSALIQQRARLATLDSLLRARFKPGSFALDDDLQPAFPADDFWYLYGQPVEAR